MKSLGGSKENLIVDWLFVARLVVHLSIQLNHAAIKPSPGAIYEPHSVW